MNLVARVKNILLTPQTEWGVIEREAEDRTGLLKSYVAILAAIPAVCGFIGTSIVGIAGHRTPIVLGLVNAIGGYLLTFVGVFVVAFVANTLAEKFGGRSHSGNAFKLAAYTPTAAWVASVFTTIPVLAILTALGLYSFYLLYTGAQSLMKVPQDKALTYFLAILAAAIVVWVLVLFLPAMLIGSRLI